MEARANMYTIIMVKYKMINALRTKKILSREGKSSLKIHQALLETCAQCKQPSATYSGKGQGFLKNKNI